MSEWDGPATQYEITVAGDDDVLDDIAVAVRAWANPRGRRFFMWRAMPKEAPAVPAAPALDVHEQLRARLALGNKPPAIDPERLAEAMRNLFMVPDKTAADDHIDDETWAQITTREGAELLAVEYARLANPENVRDRDYELPPPPKERD